MVGRSGPLRELQTAFKNALRGQRQIIFVAGEPGIGKITLVDTFDRHASIGDERYTEYMNRQDWKAQQAAETNRIAADEDREERL
jgi:Cdc6-like AAA superfamily ATPase